MVRSAAFLVVGHRHWGKSRTLAALGHGRRGRVQVVGRDVFIRRMSNDDKPESYADFISNLDPRSKPIVVLAYCPEPGSEPKLLKALARKYSLHFWIMEQSYTDRRKVSPGETAVLRTLGKAHLYEQKGEEAKLRSADLSAFIQSTLS